MVYQLIPKLYYSITEGAKMKFKGSQSTNNDEVSIISSTMQIQGNILTKGNLRIDGKIKGDIKAEGVITIGPNGYIEGNIDATNVTIGGKILGTVICREKLVLEDKSQLKGDLTSKILIVEEGALFTGRSAMLNSQETKPE
jgi:cytoskeletal protein CcmA (bactofilin family)